MHAIRGGRLGLLSLMVVPSIVLAQDPTDITIWPACAVRERSMLLSAVVLLTICTATVHSIGLLRLFKPRRSRLYMQKRRLHPRARGLRAKHLPVIRKIWYVQRAQEKPTTIICIAQAPPAGSASPRLAISES